MKHLSKLAAILAALVLACAFFGCSDGSDGDQSISLSDGDYTLKIKQSADGKVKEYDIKATASNNILTFNSGSVTSFDGNKVIKKADLSAAELAEMQENYPLSSIPADAKIETITDKTEYKVTLFMEGMQMEFHIKKD